VARGAIDRALEADLTMRELKVFLATLKLITNFDRTEDRIANRQYVDATGIDERHIRRALRALHDKGVIERVAGHGRTASLIRLEGADPARLEGARMAPPEGADSDVGRGPIRTSRGGRQEPASEVPSEVLSEVCVSAFVSKLTTPTEPKQRDEAIFKSKSLAAVYGPDALIEALDAIPDGSVRFAGELDRHLRATLQKPARAAGGYVPGHQPSSSYPHQPQPVWDLDEDGNAVRIA
jgi:hypothetical protein